MCYVSVEIVTDGPQLSPSAERVVGEADVNCGVRAGKTRTGLHRNVEMVNKYSIIKGYSYRNAIFIKYKGKCFFVSSFPISEKHRFWKVPKRHPLVLLVRVTYRCR